MSECSEQEDEGDDAFAETIYFFSQALEFVATVPIKE
jgi:hypothetical protein